MAAVEGQIRVAVEEYPKVFVEGFEATGVEGAGRD